MAEVKDLDQKIEKAENASADQAQVAENLKEDRKEQEALDEQVSEDEASEEE
ncbi:MAG: hypothetical protein JWN64_262 [Parcubacteria group bacterium]|nr:hypothetical protein [Parcubacteria group bacterium]